MKKKFEKPEVKVLKMEAMDVIATSGGDTPQDRSVYFEGQSYQGTSWQN